MTRRGNGEGSIGKVSDRWQARITLPDGRRKAFYGQTRAEVARKLREALKAKDDGVLIPGDRLAVAQYLPSWLEAIKSSVRDTTYTRYEGLLRLHAVPMLGKLPLSKLSPQHLAALYADRLSAGLHPTTVGHLHRVLHLALGQAAKWGLLIRNPVDLVSPPKAERSEMQTLSPEEAQRFLQAAAEDRLSALYVVALTTGMRQGEMLALRWDAVDLDRTVLEVRATVHRTRQGFVFSPPKTAKSRRQVLLTPLAVAALRRHKAAQAEERLRLGAAWDGTFDLLFGNEIGRPIEPQNLARRSYRRILDRAGLTYRPFHSLRHSAATLLLGRNVHPAIVASLLGHARVSTTLDVYSHALPTMQQAATEAMQAVLGG